MAALRYTLRPWAERTIGSSEPARVRDWFLARGLDAPRQTWRKLLQDAPRSVHLATWVEICEAADEPLVAFLQIIPSGRCKPKARFRPGKKPARRPRAAAVTPASKPVALPPRPSEFFRRLGDG